MAAEIQLMSEIVSKTRTEVCKETFGKIGVTFKNMVTNRQTLKKVRALQNRNHKVSDSAKLS